MDTTKIKDKIKKTRLSRIIRLIMRPYFVFVYLLSSFQGWLRNKNIVKSTKYQYLLNLKQIHAGERCFVVATGPSLTFEDLDMIKGEYCFGMNSCVLALDKTQWTPNVLAIQDEFVYNKIQNVLVKESQNRLKNKIWVSNTISSMFDSAKTFRQFPLHYLDHKYDPDKILELRFSENPYVNVFDGYSIIFSVLQLAVYMGFKEIYLLGTDCNYKQPQKNFIEHGATALNNLDIAGTRLIVAHQEFKKFADSKGVKIINCTRGGMLEVYPRMKLEEVI